MTEVTPLGNHPFSSVSGTSEFSAMITEMELEQSEILHWKLPEID